MKKLIGRLVIFFGLLSVALAILNYFLNIKILTHLVIFSFVITSFIIGLDCMLSKKIVMPSRYSKRLSETYIGIAAYAHGVIFFMLAGFLFTVNYLILADTGNNFFKMIIRRPGFLFLVIGIYIISFSIIAFAGYQEQKQTTKFVYYLDLVASRLLPGIILTCWGIGFIVIGVIEIINPEYFDSIGGGFLEILLQKK